MVHKIIKVVKKQGQNPANAQVLIAAGRTLNAGSKE